jgi:hypothetical protein
MDSIHIQPTKADLVADQEIYKGWQNYFGEREGQPYPSPILVDIAALVRYITYLKELEHFLTNEKIPIWHLPSAILGFGLGTAMTLIITFLKSTV